MLHAVICDDDVDQLARNAACLNSFSRIHQTEMLIKTVSSAPALQTYLDMNGDLVDMIITEAQIAGQDGITLIQEIEDRLPNIKIVFVSKHPELVFQSFRIRHEGFIPVPVDQKMLCLVLGRVIEDIAAAQRKYIALAKKGLITRICLDDILYLESNRHDLKVQTRSDAFSFKEKLDSLKNQLDYRFLQCHKSYIVNMNYIVVMNDINFILRNGEMVPISARRQKDARDSFENFVFQCRSLA